MMIFFGHVSVFNKIIVQFKLCDVFSLEGTKPESITFIMYLAYIWYNFSCWVMQTSGNLTIFIQFHNKTMSRFTEKTSKWCQREYL